MSDRCCTVGNRGKSLRSMDLIRPTNGELYDVVTLEVNQHRIVTWRIRIVMYAWQWKLYVARRVIRYCDLQLFPDFIDVYTLSEFELHCNLRLLDGNRSVLFPGKCRVLYQWHFCFLLCFHDIFVILEIQLLTVFQDRISVISSAQTTAYNLLLDMSGVIEYLKLIYTGLIKL